MFTIESRFHNLEVQGENFARCSSIFWRFFASGACFPQTRRKNEQKALQDSTEFTKLVIIGTIAFLMAD